MSFLMQLQDVEAAGRLAPFSAAFRAGEIVHLVGPNGAGKSTLLTRMAGLSDGPGTVHFNGRLLDEWPARELARRRGYLCQHQTPPFAMPVWHYLALHMQQQGDSARLQRVRLAAVILQIDPLSNSAGQLLLLDEPMNSLDVAQQAALDRLLHELSAAGIAVVMSSHDLNHTLRHAGQSWLLCQGEAIACGETAEVLNEENLTAAYAIPFQRVEVAGHIMLIASQ